MWPDLKRLRRTGGLLHDEDRSLLLMRLPIWDLKGTLIWTTTSRDLNNCNNIPMSCCDVPSCTENASYKLPPEPHFNY